MKINKLAAAVGASAVIASIAAGTVVPASAVNNIKLFGTQMTLKEGANEIGYTVAGLGPSNDTIPHAVNGQLYESTVTVDAIAVGSLQWSRFSTPALRMGQTTVSSPTSLHLRASAAHSCRRAASRPARSTLMSWALTCRTASSSATEFRIFWLGRLGLGRPTRLRASSTHRKIDDVVGGGIHHGDHGRSMPWTMPARNWQTWVTLK